MTLNDFRTRAARVSGMSPSEAADLSLLDSWANEAVEQFLVDTKINVRTASLALTAETADYTLDTDILSLEDIWIEAANGRQDNQLRLVSSAEVTQMRIYEAAEDATVMYYALEGAHTLLLYPAPQSSSDELHIRYVPRVSSVMSATADTPSATAYGNIPPQYHPIIEEYVKWKACEAEEHRPSESGRKHQEAYFVGVAKVKADLNRKTGVMAAPAQWGRRQTRIPTSPGVDLGI